MYKKEIRTLGIDDSPFKKFKKGGKKAEKKPEKKAAKKPVKKAEKKSK